ncbi:RagB/SusD family nutrient uptake outer membrane protein [Agriterribacter sp.]|uniref:RagB/SusD family nutrient uptake outer membrane protein n=1 Tax=Agriterribacter sp. TaxID=2821509 RepID=UPI002D001C45|nr:RagB/SusD family nutrient uptake outer membrane protein [Agriterribacter sp.]HRP56432.1 RagB/SusD family nutrient uptake outer membrane protein [Agriterribacter sp.]
MEREIQAFTQGLAGPVHWLLCVVNGPGAGTGMGMFYRYGGVPIVAKSFLPNDDMNIPRASLQETLDYILALCDEAIAGLPDTWSAQYYGRFTKGAAMAIKARTLQFAARPLFNTGAPYLDFGENNKMISFGSQDNTRWDKAIAANEAVLSWAQANGYALINTGGAGTGKPNPNALNDYGTATSVPGNSEVLLACKVDENMSNICVYVFFGIDDFFETLFQWSAFLVCF